MKRAVAEETLKVRLSHLLRDCSVGAIVRGQDSLMVVQDTRTWDRPQSDPRAREIRYVERVRSMLKIEQVLCAPPRAVERDGRVVGWIPALRFPTWARCLTCGLLHAAPWRRRQSPEDVADRSAATTGVGGAWKCACGGRLEQTSLVLVHEAGYLADVPWHALAHGTARHPEQHACRPDWAVPYLRLTHDPTGRLVHCTTCHAEEPLRSGALPRLPFPARVARQPWLREDCPDEAPETPAWLLEINDVRVHSPVTPTALVIPPESRIRRGTVVDRLYGSSSNQRKIRNAKTDLARRAAIARLATEYRCEPSRIEGALAEIDEGYPLYGRTLAESDVMIDEYRALIEEIPDLTEGEDFVTEHHTDAWKALGQRFSTRIGQRAVQAVSRLIAVNKLKEVMVLKGFTRAGGDLVQPDIAGESDWLPAIELYGESIFFTLGEEWVAPWEDNDAVCERAEPFRQRHLRFKREGAPGFDEDITPRFLLCHTLAHLLIRQLEAAAGYPAAALKERIYCETGDEARAGVLIYVAVADEEGSLGGLMELARPERFLRLLIGAFEAATWCSFDPVCSEQQGHGPGLLNGAACHACALVPETTCAYGNMLLDRVFVTGGAPGIAPFLDGPEMRG